MTVFQHELSAKLRLLASQQGDLALAQSIAETLLHGDHAALRILHSHVKRFDEAATGCDQHQPESHAVSLPLAVQAHYLKSLLDWVISQLVRQQTHSKPNKGATGQQQEQQLQLSHPRERPEAWHLLSALLACGWAGLASASAVPASILASIASACHHASVSLAAAPEQGAQLLLAVEGALRLLLQMPRPTPVVAHPQCAFQDQQQQQQQQQRRTAHKVHAPTIPSLSTGTFRPSLDQCVAFVAAVIEHPAASGQQAWQRVSLLSVQLLHAVVHGLPNTKKVFEAVVSRLYGPLARIAFEGAAALPLKANVAGHKQPQDIPDQLHAAVLHLLEAVIMHDSHIIALVDMSEALASENASMATAQGGGTAAATADRDSKAQDGTNKRKKDTARETATSDQQSPAVTAVRSFHFQILLVQVIQDAVSSVSLKAHAAEQEQAQAILASLPWLLESFCRAIARQKQLAAADAASAAWWAARPDGARRQQGGRKRPAGEQDTTASSSGVGARNLLGSEFKFYTVLASMLMAGLGEGRADAAGAPAALATEGQVLTLSAAPAADQGVSPGPGNALASTKLAAKRAHKEQQQHKLHDDKHAQEQAQRKAPDQRLAQQASLVSALGALLGAVKTTGAYQPTRDLAGTQRAALQQVADAVMAQVSGSGLAAGQGDADHAQASIGAAGLAPLLVGCCSTVCAVLDLDHRTLQPHLAQLWQLLWLTAATPSGPSSLDPAAIAASAGCRLILAYQELRQLRFLVASLLTALHATASAQTQTLQLPGPGTSSKGGQGATLDAGLAVAVQVNLAAAAAAVVRNPTLLAALHTAVRQIPPGQCPAIVELVATDIAAWLGSSAGSGAPGSLHSSRDSVVLAAAEVYSTCLAALRVDLTTAVPVATAVQELIRSCLATPLARGLGAACSDHSVASPTSKSSKKQQKRQSGVKPAPQELHDKSLHAELALLLHLYSGLVRLHSLCASMHPEISFLSDQGPSAVATTVVPSTSAAAAMEASTGPSPSPTGSYFSAALQLLDGQPLQQLPTDPLQALARHAVLPLAAADCGSAGAARQQNEQDQQHSSTGGETAVGLARVVHSCLLQRLQMLNEQVTRLACTCRVTTTASKATGEASALTADACSGMQTAKEVEARQLAAELLAPLLAAAQTPGWQVGQGLLGIMGRVATVETATSTAATSVGGETTAQAMAAAGIMTAETSGAWQDRARYTCIAWLRCLTSAACWVRWVQQEDLAQALQLMMSACCADDQQQEAGSMQSTGRAAQAAGAAAKAALESSGGGATQSSAAAARAAAGTEQAAAASCLQSVAAGSHVLLGLVEFAQHVPVQAALPQAAMQLAYDLTQQAFSELAGTEDLQQQGGGPKQVEASQEARRKRKKSDAMEQQMQSSLTGQDSVRSVALLLMQQAAQDAAACNASTGGSNSGGTTPRLAALLQHQSVQLQQHVEQQQQQQHLTLNSGHSKAKPAVDEQQCQGLQQLRRVLDLTRTLHLASLTTRQLALMVDFYLATCAALLHLQEQLLAIRSHQRFSALEALQAASLLAADIHMLLTSRASSNQHQQHQGVAMHAAVADPTVVLSWAAGLAEYVGLVSLQMQPARRGAPLDQRGTESQVAYAMRSSHAATQLLRAACACAWATHMHPSCKEHICKAAAVDPATAVDAHSGLELLQRWCSEATERLMQRLACAAPSTPASSNGHATGATSAGQALQAYVQSQTLTVLASEMAVAVSAAGGHKPSRTAEVGKGSGTAAVVATATEHLHNLGDKAAVTATQLTEVTSLQAAVGAPEGAARGSIVRDLLLQQAAACLLEVCGYAVVAAQHQRLPKGLDSPSGATASDSERSEKSDEGGKEEEEEEGGEEGEEEAAEDSALGQGDQETTEEDQVDVEDATVDAGTAADMVGVSEGEDEEPARTVVSLSDGPAPRASGTWSSEQRLLLAGMKLIREQVAMSHAVPFPEASTLLALRVVHLLAAVSRVAPASCRRSADKGSELVSWLVHSHMELLQLLSPPMMPSAPQPGGAWGSLFADVTLPGPARAARLELLQSLRALLQECSHGQLLAAVRGVTDQLLMGNTRQSAATLLPRLQMLLLALEEVPGSHALTAMATHASVLTPALLQLLPHLQLELSLGQLVSGAAAAGPETAAMMGAAVSGQRTEGGRAPLAAAVSMCCLLRCLESVAGRDKTFQLSSVRSVCMVAGVAALFPWHPFEQEPCHSASVGPGGDMTLLHSVFCSAASLLACLLRHRTSSMQRALPLVAQVAGGMLQVLVRWASSNGRNGRSSSGSLQAPHAASTSSPQAALLRSATELSRVYEATASQDKRRVSKYCLRMLADYIIAVASYTALVEGTVANGGFEHKAGLPAAVGAVLQQGAFHLLACLSPGELQHLHVTLGPGVGGARRQALATLGAEYEKAFKYEGKV